MTAEMDEAILMPGLETVRPLAEFLLAQADAWEPTSPPEGEGWQYWETVSDGSPISPVFGTAEQLSHWLQTDYSWGHGPLTKEQADSMIRVGWAPSAVMDSTGLHPGDTVVS